MNVFFINLLGRRHYRPWSILAGFEGTMAEWREGLKRGIVVFAGKLRAIDDELQC